MPSVASRLGAWLVGAALVAAVGSGDAAAFSVSLSQNESGALVRRPANTVLYALSPGCSADVPFDACEAAVEAAFSSWEGHDCGALTFVKDTTAWTNAAEGATTFYQQNGRSELMWIEDARWVYGSYVLGITTPVFNQATGHIIEGDIIFNGYNATWSVSGATGSTDVENVAVHEIGHYVGLQHVLSGFDWNDPPTMAVQADPHMKTRTPEADDIAGICFLYPAAPLSCASDSECPAILARGAQGEYISEQISCGADHDCGGLTSVLPQGGVPLGGTCTASDQCLSAACYAVSTAFGLCTRPCATSPDDCPSGFECHPWSDQPSAGLCFALPSLAALGELCADDEVCESGLCADLTGGGARCVAPCEVLSAGGCAVGEACQRLASTSLAGACQPAGVGALGADCADDGDCESLLCDASRCAEACDALGAAEGCADDAAPVCREVEAGAALGACVPEAIGPAEPSDISEPVDEAEAEAADTSGSSDAEAEAADTWSAEDTDGGELVAETLAEGDASDLDGGEPLDSGADGAVERDVGAELVEPGPSDTSPASDTSASDAGASAEGEPPVDEGAVVTTSRDRSSGGCAGGAQPGALGVMVSLGLGLWLRRRRLRRLRRAT